MMLRNQRNNNPGNLRFAKQAEATGKDDKGFAIFPDAPAGFRALFAQIDLDKSRNLSLEDFIGKYAPPNENNTSSYLSFVSEQIGCIPSTKLYCVSKYALGACIAQMEGYFRKE
jgi:hypothetical protein